MRPSLQSSLMMSMVASSLAMSSCTTTTSQSATNNNVVLSSPIDEKIFVYGNGMVRYAPIRVAPLQERSGFGLCGDSLCEEPAPTVKTLAQPAVRIVADLEGVPVTAIGSQSPPVTIKPVKQNAVVMFEHDSATVTASAKQALQALRGARSRPHRLTLTASADGSGELTYNQSLAKRRARAVVSVLGVTPTQRAVNIETNVARDGKRDPDKRRVDILVEETQ
jgi:outer membrane protein OmpA-like peptidoglycan-associated protein